MTSTATDTTKRNARNRNKGARWEVEVAKGFQDLGLRIDRTRNSGALDQGDQAIIEGCDTYIGESKNHARYEPQAWMREAIVEAENYADKRGISRDLVHPFVAMKVRGKGFLGGLVLITPAEYARLIKAANDGGR